MTRYGLRSIGVRMLAVVLAAAFASGAIATYVAWRAMSDTAEVKLVEAMTSEVDRARVAIASRLDVAEAQLTAAALLADSARIHEAPIALSDFIWATRVRGAGETLELVRHEEIRDQIPSDDEARRGRWLVGDRVVVRVEVGDAIATGIVEIASLFPARLANASVAVVEGVDPELGIVGVIVSRDPEQATVRGALGSGLVLRHQVSLAPARAEVRAQLQHALGWSIGITTVLVLVLAWVLSRWVTRPIRNLAAAVTRGREELVLPPLQDDEIGELGAAIMSMHETLAHDAQLLAVGADLAHAVVRIQNPDEVVARLVVALDAAHPAHHWQVCVGDAITAKISAAHPGRVIVVPVLDGATQVGAAIGRGHATEGELRSVEMLCHTAFAAIKAINLLQAATINDKLALLGRMSAGVAHEINNPLAFVSLSLSMLDEQLDGEAQELVREALTGVDRVAQIVRDMSQVARGGSEVCKRESLVEIVEDQVKIAKARLGDVAIEFSARGEIHAMCVRPRVGQAVLNLIINAIDATSSRPGGRIEVAVFAEHDRAVVTVCDNGPGIPEHLRSQLFGAFFSTKGERGTGLGLYLSRKFIELQEGTLDIARTGPSGTTFRLELARAPQPESGVVIESAIAMGSGPPRRRVLVIDDEPQITRTLERWLSKHVEVVTANGGNEGIEKFQQGFYALVLCDWNMPGVSGADFVAAVRQLRPEALARVVIMTGGAAEVPGVRVMHKPLDRDAIRTILDV